MNDLELFLSREYYCDERFEMLLDGYANGSDEVIFDGEKLVPKEEIRPFGKHKCILLEFSSIECRIVNLKYLSRKLRRQD